MINKDDIDIIYQIIDNSQFKGKDIDRIMELKSRLRDLDNHLTSKAMDKPEGVGIIGTGFDNSEIIREKFR